MLRSLLITLILLCVVIPSLVVAGRVEADEPPKCYDVTTNSYITATKWLTSPGTLTGTNRRDVLVGSVGSDTIKGLGGDDLICSAPEGAPDYDRGQEPDPQFEISFSDDPAEYGAPDIISGGTGADVIEGVGTLSGDQGDDHVTGYLAGTTADGGSGNDRVAAYQGESVSGGSGNDVVIGAFSGALSGGSGNDEILVAFANPGVRVDCGSGRDSLIAAFSDVEIRRCET